MTADHLRTIAARFAKDAREDDVPGLAAEIAYRFLFALFPFGLFLAALGAFVAGWLGVENPAELVVGALGDNLPPDIARGIQPELEQVIGSARPDLLTAGALGALWAASGGTNALIKAMNRAYAVEETRPVLHRLALVVGLTILAGAGIIVSFVTIVGGAMLSEQLAERLGLTGPSWTAVWLLRWPATYVLLVAAVAILFRLAPNIRPSWRWAVGGAAVFATGWLLATWAFAFYVGTFANYGATYGALGGVIVVMFWFYLTGLLLVAAAGLTAAAASVIEPEALQRRRDEIGRDLELQRAAAGAQRAAGQAVGRVLGAFGVGHDGGSPGRGAGSADRRRTPDRRVRNDRRAGPLDRRHPPLHSRPGPG